MTGTQPFITTAGVTTPTTCPICSTPWNPGVTTCPSCGTPSHSAVQIVQNSLLLAAQQNPRNNPAQNLYGLVTPQNGVNLREVFRKWLIGPLCLILGIITMTLLNADIVVTTMIWGINSAAFIGGVLVFVLATTLFFVTLYRK